MRKTLRTLMSAAFTLVVGACSGGGGDAYPTPTPTPTPIAGAWRIFVSGAAQHDGYTAMARAVDGTTVLDCVSEDVVSVGTGSGNATIDAAGLVSGTSVRIELVLNLNAGATFESATDHEYNQTFAVGTTSVVLQFAHGNPAGGGWTAEGAPGTTWASGTGCPGT